MVDDLKKLDFHILGVVTPSIKLPPYEGTIKDIVSFKTEESLKMVGLTEDIDLNNLSTKEYSKLQLAHNLGEDIIVLYDFSKGLNQKEINYFKLLFKKICEHNKKVILVSRNINFLAYMCDSFAIYSNHLIYFTKDIFDDKLYEYIDMPHIVKFIKMANSKGADLSPTIDINELIKDIYRRIHA